MELTYKVVPVEKLAHEKEMSRGELFAEWWREDSEVWRNAFRYQKTGKRKYYRASQQAVERRKVWEQMIGQVCMV